MKRTLTLIRNILFIFIGLFAILVAVIGQPDEITGLLFLIVGGVFLIITSIKSLIRNFRNQNIG